MRILYVDSDESALRSVEIMLRSEQFNVYCTMDGEETVELGKLYDYDCIALELALPDMSGYDVIRTLRTSRIKTPILVVSRLHETEDKVKALDIGADTYMTKPFDKDELVANIHALVRRSKGHTANKIQIGDLIVNLDAKSVTVAGAPIKLTGKEYQMLELMALRKGQPQSKESFLNYLYGGIDEPDTKIIDVFVCKIRKKLPPGMIQTIWGRGHLVQEAADSMVGAA